jgi:hypothetical protein
MTHEQEAFNNLTFQRKIKIPYNIVGEERDFSGRYREQSTLLATKNKINKYYNNNIY